MIFANTHSGEGYDLVLLGQVDPAPIDIDGIEERLTQPEYRPVAKSLAEIGMHSAVDLFSTFIGQARDFEPWLRDAQINRDRNLRLQYLAGRGLNLFQANTIFDEMENYAGAPDDIFVGSQEKVSLLLQRIRSSRSQ
jgi:spermidine synthase